VRSLNYFSFPSIHHMWYIYTCGLGWFYDIVEQKFVVLKRLREPFVQEFAFV
jgi:hypothetical protein